MKKILLAVTLMLGLGFLAAGCSSKPTVDPSQAEKTFATATNLAPDLKVKIQQGLAAAKAGEYGKALVLLGDLSYDLDDPDQQSVLMDLVQQIEDVLGDQADAAKEAALQVMKGATNQAESAAEKDAAEHEMPPAAATNAVGEAEAAAKAAKDTAKDAATKAAADAAKKLSPSPKQ